jgi:steroid delta-isomerase
MPRRLLVGAPVCQDAVMAEREQVEALVTRYVDAVARQDVEATVACFAPDAVQHDPVGSPPNVGEDAIRAFFEKSFAVPFRVNREGDTRICGDEETWASFRFTIEVPTGDGAFLVRVADLAQLDAECRIKRLWAVQDVHQTV